MEWPAKEDLKPAPPSYEALEGYPGVFICVEVRAVVGRGTGCRRFDRCTVIVECAHCICRWENSDGLLLLVDVFSASLLFFS